MHLLNTDLRSRSGDGGLWQTDFASGHFLPVPSVRWPSHSLQVVLSDYTSKWKSWLDLLASFLADILEGRGDPFGHYLHVRLNENPPVVTGDVADLELSDA
jgi:hypothetical protein